MAKLIGVYLQYQNADGSTYFMATECSKEHWEKVESSEDVESAVTQDVSQPTESQDIAGMKDLKRFINETSPIKISSIDLTILVRRMEPYTIIRGTGKKMFRKEHVLSVMHQEGYL